MDETRAEELVELLFRADLRSVALPRQLWGALSPVGWVATRDMILAETGWSSAQLEIAVRLARRMQITGPNGERLFLTREPQGGRQQWPCFLQAGEQLMAEASQWMPNRRRDLTTRAVTIGHGADVGVAGTDGHTVIGRAAREYQAGFTAIQQTLFRFDEESA